MTEEHDLSIYDLSIYMICLSTSSVYLHASARSRHPQLVREVEVVEKEGVEEEEEEEAPLPRAPAPSLHTPRRQSELNTQVRTLQQVCPNQQHALLRKVASSLDVCMLLHNVCVCVVLPHNRV